MKTNKEIDVELVRIEGDLAPFVMVDYLDRDAHEYSGLLLIDSGSTANILSHEMSNFIGKLSMLDDQGATISSIGPEVMDVDQVKFSFALGGVQFHETFFLSSRQIPCSVKGMKVLGLLGNQFMQQHNLVLDFSDYTLHTSRIGPDNLAISDCAFFFPMEIGLRYYGLPVVSVSQNGKELVTLVDSGSTSNMISCYSLAENKFRHKLLESKDVINNITGSVEVNEAIVWFTMLSLDTNDVYEVSRRDHFFVLPCNVMATEEGNSVANEEQIPPIEVLIGCPFMAKEGWTLDFGAKIMYKLKAA